MSWGEDKPEPPPTTNGWHTDTDAETQAPSSPLSQSTVSTIIVDNPTAAGSGTGSTAQQQQQQQQSMNTPAPTQPRRVVNIPSAALVEQQRQQASNNAPTNQASGGGASGQ